MKTLIQSYLRHAFTALAAVGGYLASKGWIEAADVSGVDSAMSNLADALAAVLAAIIARLVISLLGKLSTSGAAKVHGMSFVIGAGMAAGYGISLSSCSPGDREILKTIPIKACYIKDGNSVCYSSKAGIEIAVDQSSGK